MDQGTGLADRARLAAGPAHCAGHAQQLGVGVAHVELGEPAAVELAQNGVAREAVVDLSRKTVGRSGAGHELGPGTHGRSG